MSMTDNEAVKLLQGIRQIVLCAYPFSESSRMSARLCLTLGMIAGLASKAVSLQQQEENHDQISSMSDRELNDQLQELGLELDSWTKAAGVVNSFIIQLEEEIKRRQPV